MADNTAMGVVGKVVSDTASAPRGRVPALHHNRGKPEQIPEGFLG